MASWREFDGWTRAEAAELVRQFGATHCIVITTGVFQAARIEAASQVRHFEQAVKVAVPVAQEWTAGWLETWKAATEEVEYQIKLAQNTTITDSHDIWLIGRYAAAAARAVQP